MNDIQHDQRTIIDELDSRAENALNNHTNELYLEMEGLSNYVTHESDVELIFRVIELCEFTVVGGTECDCLFEVIRKVGDSLTDVKHSNTTEYLNLDVDTMRGMIEEKPYQMYPVGQVDDSNKVVFNFYRDDDADFVIHFPTSFYRELQEQQRRIYQSREPQSEEEKQDFVKFCMLFNTLNHLSSVDDIVLYISLLQMMFICDGHDMKFIYGAYHVFEVCDGVWSDIEEELC